MRDNKNRIIQLVLMACFALSMTSCRETIESIFSDDIAEGDEVMFTTSLPTVAVTRSDKDDYQKAMEAYQAVSEAYEFTIEMYEKDNANPVGTCKYGPSESSTIGDLAVKTGETPLYWPSTTKEYGFKATAGTEELDEDQATEAKWLLQDRLEGYGYIQKWDDDSGSAVDKLDELNYRTAKKWKALNKDSKLVSEEADYKKIPLYLQHKRSLITVILKAGEGVSPKALAFELADMDLSAEIYSYKESVSKAIKPLAAKTIVNYGTSEEDTASSTRYDAIVEPYDYSAKPEDDRIAKVSLSGQNYSFYAGNDVASNAASYNLAAGKHLTITVTLSRDSRKVMMSAYIEDWTEDVTTTICDDHGNAGEPIYITTKDELANFLANENKNKPGNVALIKNDIILGDWTANDLRCTLNLGGHVLTSNNRLLNTMGEAANLQNGTIKICGIVDAAITTTNNGTIEDVKITADENGKATKAGAVVCNIGTISKCNSSLSVSGADDTDYVGGIAATSLISESKTNIIIDGCIVTNRVEGGKCGGGIVGLANGNVTNNTFEYGITLLQDKGKHKNIVGELESGDHKFENNSWPTVDENLNMENKTATEDQYTGIIDSQEELSAATSGRYRLAKDITVSSSVGDKVCELDGNGKKITTSKMIFGTITGKVHDLTVYVSDNLVAENNSGDTDYMAPLAYAVSGPTAEIRDVIVKMASGKYIQAANPSGLVVWAKGGAAISNCEVTADIRAKVSSKTGTERKYAGGIVSTASKAVVDQCIFHSASRLDAVDSGVEVVYFGGVVGGVNHSGTELPELTITDCTSFCTSYITDPEDSYHGGILGYAVYDNKNATTKDCQGNWWPNKTGDTASKGVAVYATGTSVEAAIGKRNAITPTEQTD